MSAIVTLSAGATEAQVQSALNGLADGGKLVLAGNQTVTITSGLVMDVSSRSVTLDLNGSTLQQAGDVTVLTVRGAHAPGQSAVLGRDPANQITVASTGATPAAAVGDWIKVYSDSLLPSDHGTGTRLGQAMEVIAVDGNRLTLKGELFDAGLYVQNVRISKYEGGEAVIQNGTVRGDQENATWVRDLIQLRSTVDADLNHLTVRDGNSMGINIVDSVNARVSQTAVINLTDDPATGHNGYGVHSASSYGTNVQGLYAEDVRHATDNNAVGTAAFTADASKYGGDLAMAVSDVVAYATTAPAFSWHTEGRGGSVSDSVVFNSWGVLGARGLHNSMSDVAGSGNMRGIQFYEYGDGDGSHINIDNVQLRDTRYYGYTTVGDTTNNVISNSTFETFDKKIWVADGVTTVNSVTKLLPWGSQTSAVSLTGTASDDRLLGGGGGDTIQGGAGTDYLWGGAGADVLTGSSGADRFAWLSVAEAGDVVTDFTAGVDAIDLSVIAIRNSWHGDIFAGGYVALAQSGTDTIVRVDADGGGNGFVNLATLRNVDAVAARSGISTSIHVTGVAPVVAPEPVAPPVVVAPPPAPPITDPYPDALRLTVNGTLEGTAGDDVLIGTALDDKLVGGDGDDILLGGGGGDALAGGLGRNAASYETSAIALTVDLQTPLLNSGDAAGDSYSGVAAIIGSGFGDRLFGNASANTIEGRAGADVIDGRAGADWLYGGAGGDTLSGGSETDKLFGDAGDDRLTGGAGYDQLTGGEGADLFVFDFADKQWDIITDFAAGDRISLAGFGLTGFNTNNFIVGLAPKAVAAVGTALYDSDDGILLWDADGTGAGAALRIGLVTGAPSLSATDFLFG